MLYEVITGCAGRGDRASQCLPAWAAPGICRHLSADLGYPEGSRRSEASAAVDFPGVAGGGLSAVARGSDRAYPEPEQGVDRCLVTVFR